jgi:hypothetical protein
MKVERLESEKAGGEDAISESASCDSRSEPAMPTDQASFAMWWEIMAAKNRVDDFREPEDGVYEVLVEDENVKKYVSWLINRTYTWRGMDLSGRNVYCRQGVTYHSELRNPEDLLEDKPPDGPPLG